MKKLLAVLLALSMLFAFAACGGNDEPETTTAPVEESTDAPVVEDPSVADPSVADPSTADPSVADPSAVDPSAAAPAGEMTKADFVAFLNAETAKAAKGSYKFNRVCSYINPIDVGGATGTLNKIIQMIDENSDLNSVVGGFLGIGTKTGTYPKDELDSDYALKATQLTEADLQNFKYDAATGTYSFTLANATNPKKTNATPISRFTNDFITHEEVVSGISEFTSAITVNDTNVNYKSINVEVKVADGKLASVKYAYNFDAVLNLKAVIKITGTGSAKASGTYTEFAY